MNDSSTVTRLERLFSVAKPIALFLTYQRSSFADSFRLARELKRHGAYEPVFVVASGNAALLDREIEQCGEHDISCFTEEEIIAESRTRAVEKLVADRLAQWPTRARFQQYAPPRRPLPSRLRVKRRKAGEFVARNVVWVRRTLQRVAALAAFARIDALRRWRWLKHGIGHRLLSRPVLFTNADIVTRHGEQIIVTWRCDPARVAACDVYLRDGTRDPYHVWSGLSSASVATILNETTFTLNCYDSAGRRLPSPPALTIHFPRMKRPILGSKARAASSEETLGAHRALRGAFWFWWFACLTSFRLRYRRLLRTMLPDVVCLPEDIIGPLTAPMIQAARQLQVPSAIIPYTIPNPIEGLEYAFRNSESETRSPDHDRLIATFPDWVKTFKGKRLFRTNPHVVVASELAGIAPPEPFTANSGHADAILVESEAMLQNYRKYGFPDRQLMLAGAASDDLLRPILAEKHALREALYRKLGMPPGRPMLLTALIPDQLSGGAPFCEFETYAEIVDFWVGTLASNPNFNVVVRIHQRNRLEEFLYLEKLGVKIATDDTVDLVPLADIYVASISSTLRWAAACGIPCINYDLYHYRYGDYAQAPGIIHAETKDEYIAAVDALMNDDAYRAKVTAIQAANAPSWGRLDGQSTSRIVSCFDQLREKVAEEPLPIHALPRNARREAARKARTVGLLTPRVR